MADDAKEKGAPWLAITTAVFSLASAVGVAWLSHGNDLRLAELESASKAASIALETDKFHEVQETRRQQFMEKHLGELISPDEGTRRVAKALFFAIYPSETADTLQQVAGATDEGQHRALSEIQQEAQLVRSQTGNWVVVVSGDKTVDLAKRWANNGSIAQYSPTEIFLRDGVYRVTVGSYPTRQQAEEAAVGIRTVTRPDAYVVALGRWCSSQSKRKENGVELVECKK